jgi:hypothetical protein
MENRPFCSMAAGLCSRKHSDRQELREIGRAWRPARTPVPGPLPRPGRCSPGWTADQLFGPSASPYPDELSGGVSRPDTETPSFTGPPVELRPFIEQAFTQEHVAIEFAGFSGEALHGVIQEPLDEIRTGRLKFDTVAIRLLLPDTTRPMVLPCRTDDLAEDPDHRARAHRLTSRHAHAILDSVQKLASLGLIRTGPPACPATVLSPSRFIRLGTSLPDGPANGTSQYQDAPSRSARKPQTGLASSTCRTAPGQ